ncbi:DoxX protein [Raineya orbicola]|jgi:uncharacterized membrane protein YphA (DoxX/SURF4 family)|uniref:DoxX n=1 Tax=Raineya orbicola TaxID=2016530 RepID=A0A2N3HY26_9BACT|nr:DoxX protein [Raineya orbicola]PKQ62954.1 DoxX [Raineya orbicola]
MRKIKVLSIINIIVSLFLGWTLFWGGVRKFSKPLPAPTAQIEAFKKGELEKIDEATLKIKNYIFGMKQTGYFWQFLGVSEILAGLLLFSQFFRFAGATIALPMTIQIFLFHLYLEPHEVGELIETAFMLLINVWLIAFEYPKWKHLVLNKSIL